MKPKRRKTKLEILIPFSDSSSDLKNSKKTRIIPVIKTQKEAIIRAYQMEVGTDD